MFLPDGSEKNNAVFLSGMIGSQSQAVGVKPFSIDEDHTFRGI
jgi:hypothetical protein